METKKISFALGNIVQMQEKGQDAKARKALKVLNSNISLLKQAEEVVNCRYLHKPETIRINIAIKATLEGLSDTDLISVDYRQEWIDKKLN